MTSTRSVLIAYARLVRTYITHLRWSTQPFSTTCYHESPHGQQEEAQLDREKMNTEANEESKTGTHSTVANNQDAAFGSNKPNPQDAKDKAGEGHDSNPLEMSAANPDVSQGTGEVEGGVKKKASEGGGGRQSG